jgi:hypothetical protein
VVTLTFNPWNAAGPLSRDALDETIRAVQDRLDLLAVLRERYGMQVDGAGIRWRTTCFLPSLVSDFAGSCAQQDAADSGELPRNLWVEDGDTTRVWRCHSCKRRGDVIDLIEHADALPRNGQAISLRAVRAAAKLAGVTFIMDGRAPNDADEPDALVCTDATPPKPRPAAMVVAFDRARSINGAVSEHWRNQLVQSTPARAELTRRNVTDEQIERYLIGYAPAEWRDLVGKLRASWREDATTLGLLGRNRLGNLYDRQRDRIVFPYCEPARDNRPPSITGFAGRVLTEDLKAPKWLNSTNVAGVWSKSSALLGLYQAQQRASDYSRVAITEGIYDSLAFDHIGKPAVALVSAALTAQHLAVIVDVLHAQHLTIAFDGDETGRREAITAATTALQFGFAYEDVTLIDPGDGKDPDDLAPAALIERWDVPLSIVEFALMFGHLVSSTHKLALLAALSTDAGDELCVAWNIDASAVDKQRARGDASTPIQRLAATLLRAPDLAQHLAAAEVTELFAADTLAARKLADLHFGESTDLAALPRDLRIEWLTCRAQQLAERIAVHDVSDPFAFAPEDSFRAWFDHGEKMREDAKRLRECLDGARAHG